MLRTGILRLNGLCVTRTWRLDYCVDLGEGGGVGVGLAHGYGVACVFYEIVAVQTVGIADALEARAEQMCPAVEHVECFVVVQDFGL